MNNNLQHLKDLISPRENSNMELAFIIAQNYDETLQRELLFHWLDTVTGYKKDWAELTSLNLAYKNLTFIPESLGNLQKLVSLDLGGNKLTNIPKSLGNLHKLESLYLYNNPLPSSEISKMKQMLPNCKIY